MPQKLRWTDPQDARIRRLRAEGATWDRIAAALVLSRYSVIARGRRIGAALPPPEQTAAAAALELLDPHREPLPPGHDVTWGAITRATCLAGDPYPAPGAWAAERAPERETPERKTGESRAPQLPMAAE